MIINISKEMYPKEAIIKASYYFADEYYIMLDSNDNYFFVELCPKSSQNDNEIEKKFMNEVLLQTARYTVMTQTKNIREMILGRALASTIIDDSDTGFIDDGEIKAEELLHSWFSEG